MYKIFMLIAVPALIIGWVAYSIWIRRVIKEGVDPVEAIQMATINAATWHGLKDVGCLAPSKLADIVQNTCLWNARMLQPSRRTRPPRQMLVRARRFTGSLVR